LHLETTAKRRRIAATALLALIAALALTLLPGPGTAKSAKPSSEKVRVMTRNIYLGADLTPALAATSLNQFTEATGEILRQVTRTDFPRRAKALAKEIRKREADLVGLQEVALWRTAPGDISPFFNSKPAATTVRYDFLDLLMDQLNKGKKRYRVAIVQQEFDFEAPANENGQPGDGPNAAIPNAEINGRLTMRDAILVRKGAGVRTSNAKSANFQNILVVTAQGISIPVNRGWTRVDAAVRDSRKFRFVNTHLEAFDDETQRPSIRAKQAGELVAAGGPATGRLPVVLLGDFNSDNPGVQPGDEQAFQVLQGAGFKRRGTTNPKGCCLSDPNLVGGSIADFNHQVDHILTDTPKKVKMKKSNVPGRTPVNGLYPSDHAGLFSVLKIKR
jgi:endonuclease/exonuclease/phosphatase family metal-dependent hydrolase